MPLLALFLLAAQPADAQPGRLVRVFLDCGSCDEDYIRKEVGFVEYVRDRAQAQVHLLATEEPSGGGGTSYTASFLGLGDFAGSSDTLKISLPPSATSEAHRAELARLFRVGLVRYAARSSTLSELDVSYSGAPGAVPPADDPWNRWVYSVGSNLDVSGEKLRRGLTFYPSLSAARVTQEHKLTLSGFIEYGDSRYDLGGGSILRTVSRSWNTSALYVKSLGEHWSAGAAAAGASSTFGNIAHSWELGPAAEFNVFPYSESTRRQARFLYKLQNRSVRYFEETIYGRIRENLPKHSVTVAYETKEPWGSAWLSVEGLGYLSRPGKSRVEVSGNAVVRIVEGFSLRFGGIYTRLRDQLGLPATGATQADILLQRQELESQYSFQTVVGFTYTFGSIFAEVINPRFGH